VSVVSRLEWIDRMRALAVICVVLIHVSAKVVTGAPMTGSSTWWIGNLYDSAARWCIPAFVMISGALLLTPATAEDITGFLRRRLGRTAAPLLFWSAVYLAAWWFKGLVGEEPQPLSEAWDKLLHGEPHFHLWYLFMLPGLYLSAPFLARLCQTTPRRTLWLLTATALAAGTALDALNALAYMHKPLFFELWLPYVGYFLCGHLLRQSVPGRSMWPAAGAALAGFAGTALLTWFLTQRYGLDIGVWTYSYLSPTIVCMSLGVFLLLRDLPAGTGHRFGPWHPTSWASTFSIHCSLNYSGQSTSHPGASAPLWGCRC